MNISAMTIIERSDLPYLHIYYQKDLRVLFCRWRMPVELVQVSEGYMAALHFASQQDAHFWLHDLRLRNTYCKKEHHWFTHTFVPAANEALGGSNFIAYLVSPLQHEHLLLKKVKTNKPVEQGGKNEPVKYSLFLTVHYFTNEHDAPEWLNDCRVRIVA